VRHDAVDQGGRAGRQDEELIGLGISLKRHANGFNSSLSTRP
jgi:hypothetical protein